MPYINKKRREDFAGLSVQMNSPGELNFVLTLLLMQYVQDTGLNYQSICEVTGVLDNVSKEFYRRVAVPYEEKKILENGDVY
jgi:hypothetical protein